MEEKLERRAFMKSLGAIFGLAATGTGLSIAAFTNEAEAAPLPPVGEMDMPEPSELQQSQFIVVRRRRRRPVYFVRPRRRVIVVRRPIRRRRRVYFY